MTAYSSAITGLAAALAVLAWACPAPAACNKAISVSEAKQMSFGTIGALSGGGRVTLSPSGSVTAPSGFFLTSVLATPAAGSFNVTGTNNCAVLISFTPGSLVGPGTSMTITNFTTNAGATPILTNGGRLTFSVGADLVVNASQPGGSYTGTYTVTVVY
jgi:Domain of unknown function (DUF4402)